MAPAALVMGALLAAAVVLTRVDAVWHSDAVMVNGQSVTCPCDTAPCRLWTAAEVVGGGAGVPLSQPMCSVNAATCAAGRGAVVTAADWLVGLVTKRVSLARCTAPITWTSPWTDTYASATDRLGRVMAPSCGTSGHQQPRCQSRLHPPPALRTVWRSV